MEREVRYCTTEDGVRIAYSVEGEGPVLLVCPFLWASFSVEHLTPDFARLYEALGQGRTLVRYDKRNVGLSQRDVENDGLEDAFTDLVAVVDALGSRPVSLFAQPGSVAPAVLYTARHPDRVEKLVLQNGWVRTLDIQPEAGLRALAELARANWRVAAQAMTARMVSLEHDQAGAEAWVQSTTGDAVARNILAFLDMDVTEVLGDIRCPTLVLHYAEHGMIPFTLAQRIAASIPGARLVPIRVKTSDEWLATLVSVIDPFLPKESPKLAAGVPAEAGSLRTVLFTDLVGHTEMMSRLGDQRGRDVLREHERITRQVLKANGGTEVKTMGDGFMASFGSVSKTVECAIALQRAFADREGEPLSVRVGLNAGEPIEEDGDLFGATVILASRIAAKAEGGEILVADTVRGLCSGKGFLFADRGEFVAKGFEEPVRVYEVSWRE